MWRGLASDFAAAGLLLALAAAVSGGELVFRVPEVLVRHGPAERPASYPPPAPPAHTPAPAPKTKPYEPLYEEYFVEHSISTVDARRAAQLLDPSKVGAGEECGVCGRREHEYCEARVLADHCCCERRFLREPLPWLPHTCYVGPKRCRPLARDCAQYARLRDCCCLRLLAERWKAVLAQGRGACSRLSRPLLALAAALGLMLG